MKGRHRLISVAAQAAQAILNDGGQPVTALESVSTAWANLTS